MKVVKVRYLAIVDVTFIDGVKRLQFTIHAIEGTERNQTEIYLKKVGYKQFTIIKIVRQTPLDLPSLF